jgi:hypothetical protein
VGKEQRTVVAALRDTVIEAGADDELTGTQQLQLIDLLRNMFNSEFSVESVRAARHSTPGVQRYVDQFLREVEELTGRSFPG